MAAAERAAAVAVQRDIMGMAAAAVSQRRVYLTCARPLRTLLRSDVCYLLHWRAELPFAFCDGTEAEATSTQTLLCLVPSDVALTCALNRVGPRSVSRGTPRASRRRRRRGRHR